MLIPPTIFSLYFVFSSFLPQVKHVTDQQWVKVHPVASLHKAKTTLQRFPETAFLDFKSHTNYLILQDWNSRPQHRINQNQHQVDEGHHTRHHKELTLN